jgi:hypothetical protein
VIPYRTIVNALIAKVAALEAQLLKQDKAADESLDRVSPTLLHKAPSHHEHARYQQPRLARNESGGSHNWAMAATSSNSASTPDRANQDIQDRQTEYAGLLIVMNDGESSTYVGGGATSAHRIEVSRSWKEYTAHCTDADNVLQIELQGTESTKVEQNYEGRVRQSLPSMQEAKRFCDIYFMHACVEFTVLPESTFYDQIYSLIYHQALSPSFPPSSVCNKQEWAILLLVLAIGCHFDPLRPWNNRQPHAFFDVARSLLDPCEFEELHSTSSIRALLLMGIFSANARARGCERNWPWLGIQMRIVQAVSFREKNTDDAFF